MLNFPVLDAKETIEGDIAIPSEEQEDELSQFGKVNEPSVAAISGAQQRESGVLVIFKFFGDVRKWTKLNVLKDGVIRNQKTVSNIC